MVTAALLLVLFGWLVMPYAAFALFGAAWWAVTL